jgi:RNA polymerase sigma factor for flagellar operon FliA
MCTKKNINNCSSSPDFLAEESLVVKISAALYAKRFDDSLEFDDYKNYGFIGLLEAKEKYDAAQGASFDTYAAYRIRGSILNGIVKSSERTHLYAYNARAEKDRARSHQLPKKTNTDDLFDFFVSLTSDLAISSLLDGVSQADMSVDAGAENHYKCQISSDLIYGVERLVGHEKSVIVYHYFGSLSFQEVASTLKLTKGRISQLHKSALSNLSVVLSDKSYFSVDL